MKRLWASALLAAAGIAGGVAAATADSIVLLPLQRGVRDAAAAAAVEWVLLEEVQTLGELVDRQRTRDALRRLRLRAPETAGVEVLRRLGSELEATWLLAVTLHDAPARVVPDLALSARLYEAATGELVWAGFEAASGLDSRQLLGLGAVYEVEQLASTPIRRLLLASPLAGQAQPSGPAPATRQRLALVPFTAYLQADALTASSAATEAARATLLRDGFRLAPPECVDEALRSQRLRAWGELPAAARLAVRDACTVDQLVTGSLERWEIGGTEREPRPVVALALRLLDAASGRILWMGSRERTGWDGQSLFGLGRIHSRGALLERLLSILSRELREMDSGVSPPVMTAARPEEPEEAVPPPPEARQAPAISPVDEAAAPQPPPALPTPERPEPGLESPDQPAAPRLDVGAPLQGEATPLEAATTDPEPVTAIVTAPAPTPTPRQLDEDDVAPDPAATTAAALVEGARTWVGRDVRYDPSYVEMSYPGGDPPADRGTAVDLIVRAFRRIDVDLQQVIHEDILRDRSAYGYDDRQPDTNVSHRRTRNLVVYFERQHRRVHGEDWRAGDIVFWDTDGSGRGDHVGIVSPQQSAAGRLLVIHHRRPGAESEGGPTEDDIIGRWPVAAHFRIEAQETTSR